MIEVNGPRALVAFDGRIVEVFSAESSRRIHIGQILSAEVERGGLMLEEGPVLSLRLTQGQHVTVHFASGREAELERLVAALPPGGD
jgi:hypothetical protein